MEQVLIHGNCLEEMSKLGKFDVVVCSPPYNIGINYNNYKDDKPISEYLNWIKDFFLKVYDCLEENGSFFLNLGFINRNPWLCYDVVGQARGIFHLQNTFIWVKSIAVENTTYGQFKPMMGKRYPNNNFEYIYHFSKTGSVGIDRLAVGVPYNTKTNVDKWGGGQDLRCRGNVWYIPYESRNQEAKSGLNPDVANLDNWITVGEAAERAGVPAAVISLNIDREKLLSNGKFRIERRVSGEDFKRWLIERATPKKHNHPAMFPWQLPEMCIKFAGIKEGIRVLDPFVGMGSTLLACKNLGISGVGIEIDADYAERARKRVACFTEAKQKE